MEGGHFFLRWTKGDVGHADDARALGAEHQASREEAIPDLDALEDGHVMHKGPLHRVAPTLQCGAQDLRRGLRIRDECLDGLQRVPSTNGRSGGRDGSTGSTSGVVRKHDQRLGRHDDKTIPRPRLKQETDFSCKGVVCTQSDCHVPNQR